MCNLIAGRAILNVMAFILGGAVLGGHAEKSGDGRYYLSTKHRRFEVSREIHAYSSLHLFSALASLPLAVVAGGAGYLLRRRAPLTANEPGT